MKLTLREALTLAEPLRKAEVLAGTPGLDQIAPFGPNVPDRVKQFVLASADGYKAGLLDSFIGPVRDQADMVRIAAGEVRGNGKMGDFDGLVEGIVGALQ